MECPQCKIGKVKILGSAFNPDENEAYKKRECLDCGCVFFTVEYEVLVTKQYLDTFAKYYNKKYYEQRNRYNDRQRRKRHEKEQRKRQTESE